MNNDPGLEAIRSRLIAGKTNITTDVFPNWYEYDLDLITGDYTNTGVHPSHTLSSGGAIEDGGHDMYDSGNGMFIAHRGTSLSNSIPYNTATPQTLDTDVQYLVTDTVPISLICYKRATTTATNLVLFRQGETGADGTGNVYENTLPPTTRNGYRIYAWAKEVKSPTTGNDVDIDPWIIHLYMFFVPAGGTGVLTTDFSSDTDNDYSQAAFSTREETYGITVLLSRERTLATRPTTVQYESVINYIVDNVLP